MATWSLSNLFALYRLPVGRRLHAMRRTRELVKSDSKFVGLVDVSLEHDGVLLADRTRWVEQRNLKTSWSVRVVELDQEHDRLISSIEKVVAGMEGGPADEPSTRAAGKFRRTLFAAGVAALTQIDFVQQREQTQAWLARIASESKEEVAVLGLRPMFDRLAIVTAEFGQLIDQNKQQATVTYDKLRGAEAVGHDLMLRFVVAVCEKYNGKEPGDEAARASLLAPILEQNEVVGDLYRKRALTDIDPETGEVAQPGTQPVGPVTPLVGTGEQPIGGGGSPFTNK